MAGRSVPNYVQKKAPLPPAAPFLFFKRNERSLFATAPGKAASVFSAVACPAQRPCFQVKFCDHGLSAHGETLQHVPSLLFVAPALPVEVYPDVLVEGLQVFLPQGVGIAVGGQEHDGTTTSLS